MFIQPFQETARTYEVFYRRTRKCNLYFPNLFTKR